MSEEKRKRGPRLPFGELRGVWFELANINRGLRDGTIADVDRAKARVYTLSMMLGVVDRLLEQRALDEMAAKLEDLREQMAARMIVSTTPRPALPEHEHETTSTDATA